MVKHLGNEIAQPPFPLRTARFGDPYSSWTIMALSEAAHACHTIKRAPPDLLCRCRTVLTGQAGARHDRSGCGTGTRTSMPRHGSRWITECRPHKMLSVFAMHDHDQQIDCVVPMLLGMLRPSTRRPTRKHNQVRSNQNVWHDRHYAL